MTRHSAAGSKRCSIASGWRGINGTASARILRRPTTAPRHRARSGARSSVLVATNAGRGARRLDPGARSSTCSPTSSASSGWRLPVHQPRPERRRIISTTVAVMYLGTIVEISLRDAFFEKSAASLSTAPCSTPFQSPIRAGAAGAPCCRVRFRAPARCRPVPVSNAVSDRHRGRAEHRRSRKRLPDIGWLAPYRATHAPAHQ